MVAERVGVRTLPELQEIVAAWRSCGERIGFTCGAFDLLHAGHVDYLEKARALCDRLVVAVNTDESVRSYKNPFRPVIKQEYRAKLVAALACVDAVTLMSETRPARLIKALHPDLYIKGGDYQISELKSAPLVRSYGGECAVIPVEHELSSSAIIKRIEELSVYATPEPARQKLHGPLVLLDRDGTLIENVHFLNTPKRVQLLPGVGEGLRALQQAGFSLAVVTNQQGIGLGYFDYEAFVASNSEMLRQLAPFGVQISRFYFCPHSLAEQCACRKPGTRLIERALTDFQTKPEECFLIGDAPSDLEAARAAGITGLLVQSDRAGDGPDALGFGAAVERILDSTSSLANELSSVEGRR